jgi:hypothetical protein
MDIEKTIIRSIAAVLCTLIVVSGGCTMNQHRLVANAIAGGSDPLKASCALDVPSSEHGLCVVVAAKSTP